MLDAEVCTLFPKLCQHNKHKPTYSTEGGVKEKTLSGIVVCSSCCSMQCNCAEGLHFSAFHHLSAEGRHDFCQALCLLHREPELTGRTILLLTTSGRCAPPKFKRGPRVRLACSRQRPNHVYLQIKVQRLWIKSDRPRSKYCLPQRQPCSKLSVLAALSLVAV